MNTVEITYTKNGETITEVVPFGYDIWNLIREVGYVIISI